MNYIKHLNTPKSLPSIAESRLFSSQNNRMANKNFLYIAATAADAVRAPMRAERSPMRNLVQSNWMSGAFMMFFPFFKLLILRFQGIKGFSLRFSLGCRAKRSFKRAFLRATNWSVFSVGIFIKDYSEDKKPKLKSLPKMRSNTSLYGVIFRDRLTARNHN